jgi:hypothetical protein
MIVSDRRTKGRSIIEADAVSALAASVIGAKLRASGAASFLPAPASER